MTDEEYERRAANRRANKALFAKWAREDRNQVIQELIEKAEAESWTAAEKAEAENWAGRLSGAYGPLDQANHAATWLKSQMEGE